MRRRCEYRPASLSGLPVGLHIATGPVDRDRIDVRLVVDLMLAGGDGSRLAVSFRDKFRRPDVGHPNLDGSKPLRAQSLAMFAHPLSRISQQSGKAAGAVHVPRGLLEFAADPKAPQHDARFDTEKTVILYCAAGGRAALAGQALKELGYGEVYNLGGFKDWVDADGAIEK